MDGICRNAPVGRIKRGLSPVKDNYLGRFVPNSEKCLDMV